MRLLIAFFLLVFITALTLGCGSGTGVPVSGTVTYNGKPLAEGDIIFAPAGGPGVEAAGKIAGGSYSLTALPGPVLVKIYATREEGPKDPAMGMAPRKQYLPAKYNVSSELKREVSSDLSKNNLDFTLEGPP